MYSTVLPTEKYTAPGVNSEDLEDLLESLVGSSHSSKDYITHLLGS